MTTHGFDYAIRNLKEGARMTRKGWNGKGQYIELASDVSFKKPDGTVVEPFHDVMGNNAIAFYGTSGVQIGWLASQADMLADDWVMV